MPLVPIDSLPDDARTWVFGATPALAPDARDALLAEVDDHLARWQAHGAPLTVARTLVHDRFLVVAVDQRTANASGCSIDGLYRALGRAQQAAGVELVAGGRVFWRDVHGTVQGGTRADFVAAAAAGAITPQSPAFDTTVQTLGAWRAGFERPVAAGWHAQLVPVAR